MWSDITVDTLRKHWLMELLYKSDKPDPIIVPFKQFTAISQVFQPTKVIGLPGAGR